MAEPRWLSRELVLALHDENLAQFGGSAGILDAGRLESALARPANRFAYEPDTSLFTMAASLGHGLISNHPFVDGNKRTGLLAIRVFLKLNGWAFEPGQADEVATILAVAAGDLGEDALAAWIEANSQTA